MCLSLCLFLCVSFSVSLTNPSPLSFSVHCCMAAGTALSFSPQQGGKLTAQVICARGLGTTVTVKELFARLPVRRKEFQRSAKKQYQKLVRVLQGYAIIATGVRLIVTNADTGGTGTGAGTDAATASSAGGKGTGKKAGGGGTLTVIGTQGSARMEDNISSVFGSKFLQTLIAVECTVDVSSSSSASSSSGSSSSQREEEDGGEAEARVPAESDDEDDGTGSTAALAQVTDDILFNPTQPSSSSSSNDNDNNNNNNSSSADQDQRVHIKGFVSRTGSGVGRSDNDRQFTYCNGRPVDLPKVIKVVNEVWRKVSNVFCVMLCVRVCVYVCRVGVYACLPHKH